MVKSSKKKQLTFCDYCGRECNYYCTFVTFELVKNPVRKLCSICTALMFGPILESEHNEEIYQKGN